MARALNTPLQEDLRRVNALLIAHTEEHQRDVARVRYLRLRYPLQSLPVRPRKLSLLGRERKSFARPRVRFIIALALWTHVVLPPVCRKHRTPAFTG